MEPTLMLDMPFTKLFLHNFFKILQLITPIWGTLMLMIASLSWLYSKIENISLFDALYFGGITGMSIGYGDFTPSTILGKIIALTIGFIGLITTGVIVAAALEAVRIASKKIGLDKLL
jgi:hypothetical protein